MASGLHPSSQTHTNTLIFSRHISADALSTQMTAMDSSLKADVDLRLWDTHKMTFSPCGGLMQEIFIGAGIWQVYKTGQWSFWHPASFSVCHYCCYLAKRHFVFCASDFVTGTILSCPRPSGPALKVQRDAPRCSNLSLIANKVILWL